MGAKRDWQLLQKSVGDSLGFVSVTILRCVSDLSGTEQIGQYKFFKNLVLHLSHVFAFRNSVTEGTFSTISLHS